MRWKSGKTKPTKNGLMDKIIYLDQTGKAHYNVELTGWGRSAKIGGKSWNEIKDEILCWEYMEKFEETFLYKTIKSWVRIKWNLKLT